MASFNYIFINVLRTFNSTIFILNIYPIVYINFLFPLNSVYILTEPIHMYSAHTLLEIMGSSYITVLLQHHASKVTSTTRHSRQCPWHSTHKSASVLE